MGAQQARLQPDSCLEEAGAFSKSLLLKPNGAQHGTGCGPRLGIGQRELGLLVCFLEPPLLDEGGRALEGRLRLGGEGGRWGPHAEQEHGQEKDSVPAPPSRRPDGLREGDILL